MKKVQCAHWPSISLQWPSMTIDAEFITPSGKPKAIIILLTTTTTNMEALRALTLLRFHK